MMNLHTIHIQPIKNKILWGFYVFLCIFASDFGYIRMIILKIQKLFTDKSSQ